MPTRVFNAQSLTDPRDVISIGFVAAGAEQVKQWLATAPAAEAVRHDRIDTVIESTTLRCMYELHTEHDFSHLPEQISVGSPCEPARCADLIPPAADPQLPGQQLPLMPIRRS